MTDFPTSMSFPFGGKPQHGSWTRGAWKSVDGAPPSVVEEDDVAGVVAFGTSGDRWDGNEAAVMKLKDGRLVAYESWYGPTGDGFSEDAYGGDAVVYFGYSLRELILIALTDQGRELCGFPREGIAP